MKIAIGPGGEQEADVNWAVAVAAAAVLEAEGGTAVFMRKNP